MESLIQFLTNYAWIGIPITLLFYGLTFASMIASAKLSKKNFKLGKTMLIVALVFEKLQTLSYWCTLTGIALKLIVLIQ